MNTLLKPLAVGLTLLAACGAQSAKGMDDTPPIRLQLLAEPLRLSMAGRTAFKVGLAATNLGAGTVDPQLHRTRLLVDDRDVPAWSLAIGNGRREDRWFALPPGETVSLTWTSLGERLFPAPGDYVLTLRLGGTSSPAVQVRVEADGTPP